MTPSETNMTPMIFKLLGVFFIFGAFWMAGSLNEDKIQALTARYQAKAKQWAYEYERILFLPIRVHYLVGVPAAAGILLGLLTFNLYLFLIFAGIGIGFGLYFPGMLLEIMRVRRGQKCEKQLMDAMILMSNGLKSGQDLVDCISLVQRDLTPPISEEFGLCIKNYHLGTPLEKALEGMEERVQSRLVSYMIKAVVLQRSVGGNLTKIFDRIVENIREEAKLVEKTSAMTAQQRIQAIVVGILPWGIFLMVWAVQPALMRDFYGKPLGFIVFIFCVVWMSIGMVIVKKLGQIDI